MRVYARPRDWRRLLLRDPDPYGLLRRASGGSRAEKLPHRPVISPRFTSSSFDAMACPPQVDRAVSAQMQATAVWNAVLARLRAELPGQSAAHEAWLEPLVVGETEAGGLRLECPSLFHLERVRERYLARIERY